MFKIDVKTKKLYFSDALWSIQILNIFVVCKVASRDRLHYCPNKFLSTLAWAVRKHEANSNNHKPYFFKLDVCSLARFT